MGTTTMGVKLDDATRERIKFAASRIDRTPHWLIKQAIFNYLEKLENDETLPELPALLPAPPMKAMTPAARSMSRGSHSSNLPSRSCRSPSPGLDYRRLPPGGNRRRPDAAGAGAPAAAAGNRRTSWLISWRKNCVIKKPPAVAPAWCRACCRSFRSPRRKGWR
jgi:RHH-type proline utilization regulon transcriptional repressor/proline dehydrogenase/delta 1-pyrroline-5-carboxylate dehydrogenase